MYWSFVNLPYGSYSYPSVIFAWFGWLWTRGITLYCLNKVWTLGHLDCWVVSHLALNIGMLHHTLGHEFTPQWGQTLNWTQSQHLHFLMILFGVFDSKLLFVCPIYRELWSRKLKINFRQYSDENCVCLCYTIAELYKNKTAKQSLCLATISL